MAEPLRAGRWWRGRQCRSFAFNSPARHSIFRSNYRSAIRSTNNGPSMCRKTPPRRSLSPGFYDDLRRVVVLFFFFALRAYLFSSLPSFTGFFLPGIASENRYFPLEAVSNRFYRVLPGFAGFYWVLPSFISSFEQELYSWIIFTTLKSFVQFSRALRGLNGFSGLYRVLPGFTGFYRVL